MKADTEGSRKETPELQLERIIMNATLELLKAGQSIWYDNIERRLLKNGELAGMVQRGEIRGVTSNPSIFMNAITKSQDYDGELLSLANSSLADEEVFFFLAIQDIQEAADLFKDLYEQTHGADGYVSLEVSPFLADDSAATISQAVELWRRVDRPNLMIKIPATRAGLPAITEAISAGLNVNVTLIFSIERYQEVMSAYMAGLERRLAAGLSIGSIASVASFFVSRLDTKVDAQLNGIIKRGGPPAQLASFLLGKAAIANTRLAYSAFRDVCSSARFQKLKDMGARVQRPLWASTSTKNPAYRDVIYVEELIGPDTVNTVPPQTLVAFLDHGRVRRSLDEGLAEASQVLAQLEGLGISMSEVTRELEEEGVRAFSDAFSVLLLALQKRRQAAVMP
jgi:transaldolase